MNKFFFIVFVGILLVVPSVYAQSTERYGFETGTQGWVPSTYQYGQAITAVAQSSDRAVVGTYSLKMTTNLIGGSSTNASGEAYVDMRYNPPSGVIAPVNLQAQTVTAYVYCPTGSRGNPSAPNGVQIFVKDQNFNSLYSSWVNIVENTWMQLTMTVNNAGAFDSTNVIVVGFKIGAGTGSTATYSGPLYLDVVSFDIGTPEQPSPTNQRYDFETGVQGWTHSTYQYGLAVTSVQQSATRAALGTYSLQLNTNLIGGSQTNSNGEAYVDMRYTPPSGVSAPVNLNGVEVTAWIYCPTGSRGDTNNPNGIQIFVKDETWKSEYSTWVNIFENVWFKVTLIPSTTAPQNGWMDAGFDPTKIISVGVKIGAGTGSTATYNGPIYTDVFAFPQPGVPLSDYTYNFNDVGALSGIPRWDVDPGWGAQAWSSVYLSNNALTADATFNIATDPQRKGYVNIFYAPPIYLTNKDSHTVRAEIKFDPQPGPFDFAGTLWVYDKQNERWYQNDYKSIGGGLGWNVLTFNLDDNTAYDPDLPLGQTMPLGQIVRVGIQLYANANYTGKVYFDNVTIGGREITANYPQNNVGIVGRSGTYFMLSGQQFYFAGANAEYLFEKSVPIEEGVLDSAKNMNLSVVRTWAFGEGEDASFQPQRGKFNLSAFEHLDRLIAYAGKKGIRLVLPLVDNWGHYGGMFKYMDWALAEHPESVPDYDDKGNFIDKVNKNDAYHDQFFVNPWCKQWYKDYVTYLLNRTNSITGVKYKDDPNIFSWEVFNEPRCKSDISGKRIHDWLVEMSAFVKGIESNHLVGSGEEGSYIKKKADADAITWQTYPDNYWEYGCNWTVSNGQGGYTNWGSNGADFLSDHKSTDTTVYWQAYIGAQGEAPVQSEVRVGVPNIDYTSFRTYIDQKEFNLHRLTPNDQSLKWIEQHMNDAINVIGKPVIMEEFGIHTVGYIYWGGFGETKFHRYPAYTESDRRNIYAKYYDYIYNNNIAGSFFWNLGYDGIREDLFDGCESLQHSASSTWATDPNSDATAISVSTTYFTQGTKSFKCDYVYNPANGKAFYDLPNLSEKWEVTAANPPSSGAINRAKFMFDVYNAGNVQYVAVAVLTGPSWTWHESTMQVVNSGWNTIVVDLASETWKSAASGWNYTGEIDLLDDVRKIAIGLFGYSGTGSVYVDNITIFEDDGFVIYPDDRITSIISTHAQMMSAKPAEQRWMKHLPVPWYKEENANYSGAATLQMMLDHIGDWFSQTTLYNYGRARNSPPNASSLEIDPQGMRETLMNYKPTPYYFSILSRSLVNDLLRDICYWIDYDVPGANPANTSAAVPTYAAYDNWMVVRGASASADPSAGVPNYTIYGFWLNDPAVGGLGDDSYKTASEFTTTYFKPIVSSDSWNGLYVTVAEPPPVASTAMVTIAPAKVNEETAELLQKLQNNKSLVEINWEAIIDSSLLFDQGFLSAFKDTFPRQPVKVKSLVVNGKDYYLIPFNRIIDTTTLKEATYVVMIVDAVDGHFKEAAWSEKPMDFLPISKDTAIQKVRQAAGLPTATATAILVWKPDNKSSSPYKPVWQVTINSKIWYVNQDGTVFAPVTQSTVSSNGKMWRYNLGRTSNYPNGPTIFPLSLRWMVDGHPYRSPVIANGVVYVPLTSSLKAYDATTGALKWNWTPPENEPWVFEPAIGSNGKIYVAISHWVSGVGRYTKIYCLDANTGAYRWSYDAGENLSHSSNPAVAYGIVYIGCYNGNVYALDAENGTLKWKYSTGSRIETSAAVSNNIVYIASVSKLYALNANLGTVKWSYAMPGWTQSSPSVSGGRVYIGCNDGQVRAFDASTGALKWQFNTGKWVTGYRSSPAVANNIVYIGSGNDINKVFALDATTGVLKWSYITTGSALFSSPCVSNGTVYITSQDNKLYALNASTGVLRWGYSFGGSYASTQSSPAIYSGKVYVTGLSTGDYLKLHCFK